jgi:hypothetical protein
VLRTITKLPGLLVAFSIAVHGMVAAYPLFADIYVVARERTSFFIQ